LIFPLHTSLPRKNTTRPGKTGVLQSTRLALTGLGVYSALRLVLKTRHGQQSDQGDKHRASLDQSRQSTCFRWQNSLTFPGVSGIHACVLYV